MRGGRVVKVPTAKKFAYDRDILNKGACEHGAIPEKDRVRDYLASEHN